ncbi:MAG: hypothetical protein ACRC10_05295 [Thermoguttaceae bacterium]
MLCRFFLGFIVSVLSLPLFAGILQAEDAKRLRRADSFLGVHFDFHAGPDCTEVGKNTTPEMVEAIIEMVKPDYLQIDCKGHRGISSYPTKVGNRAPGFVGDPLKIWRETTAKKGVALYLHYSGVLDMEAVMQHPDWAVVGADGKVFDGSDHMKGATSVFGPYVDLLMIPQLKEVAVDYGTDGVWVDGECWGTTFDYGEKAAQLFKEQTGATELPKKPGDPFWSEWKDFHREAFREYMRHYIAEVKKVAPNFQICGNWAFTDLMPEKVSIPIDFMSGDYSPEDSVNSARISARYIAAQEQPWDLMSWSFTTVSDAEGRRFKTAPQMSREAAIVLALGGGYQTYITQNRDGSVDLSKVIPMSETAKFCRERQKFTHHSGQIPQIVVLFSTEDLYTRSKRVFAPNWDIGITPIRGALLALLEKQYSVELKGECHLTGKMSEYPLIVIPECEFLKPEFVKELVQYAENGGNLLLIGNKTVDLFKDLIALKDERGDNGILEVGKGKVGVINARAASRYCSKQESNDRDLISKKVAELFPNPIVKVNGSEFVDVVANRLDGKMMIHLINTSGPHASREHPILDVIEPIGPLTVEIRTGTKPQRIVLEPSGTSCDFTFEEGVARLQLDRLEIYDILVIEP